MPVKIQIFTWAIHLYYLAIVSLGIVRHRF